MISSFLFVSMILNFTAEVGIFRNDSVEIVDCYINPQENGIILKYNMINNRLYLALDCDTLFKDGFE